MSACPSCRQKADHVAILVPREPTKPCTIIHECKNLACPIQHFEERASEPVAAVLRSFGRDPGAAP